MAILPWRVPRTLRDGHLDRDTVRACSAMAINQAELSAISQLERQHVATLVYEKPTFVSVERSFEGAPERDEDVCLEPAVK